MRVLLVKMSSLGDLVHTLPAVEDATRQGVAFDWLVEEDFVPIARMHRAVDRVVPVAFRRWRSAPVASLGELKRFRRRLKHESYDMVLDAQGLLKSAIVGGWAKADVFAGLGRKSAREPLAALRYDRKVEVDRGGHAIERTRRLFAEVIGYQLPSRAPEFGIASGRDSDGRCVLLHGTTWATKLWPEPFWRELCARVADMGLTPTLLWGNAEEARRAERIAAASTRAEVLGAMDLEGAVDVLAGAAAAVGVDSGLAHLAAALGRPTVVVFGPTDARLTGCVGANVTNLQGGLACSPCLSERCRYRGAPLVSNGVAVEPPCFSSLDPARVATALASRVGAVAA